MDRSFDEELFLAPETIVSGVLMSAEYADEPDGLVSDEYADEPAYLRDDADPIDAWARHARGANGFGG